MRKTARFVVGSLLMASWISADGAPQQEVAEVYEKAFREFTAHRYAETLQKLDVVDARATLPWERAEALNLRAVVLMRQYEYEGAEVVLQRAIEIQPHFGNAIFNLAEIPFLKRDWPEARRRFEAMLAERSGIDEETRLLLAYKIFLTHLLEGHAKIADRMADDLQRVPGSLPALYVRAGLALAQEKQEEAGAVLALAAERYPAASNKIYAESFYEIGWLKKPQGAARQGFAIRFPDERMPRVPAEATLHEALAADPNFDAATYNMAEVAFQEGQYREAREQLECLFSATPGGEDNQAAELLRYEIFLTFLLESRENEARRLLEHFKFTGVTPALYYAEAASAFAHGRPEQGAGWIASARKIYSPALNAIFAHPLTVVDWLKTDGNELELAGQRMAGAGGGLVEISSREGADASSKAPLDELLHPDKWASAETAGPEGASDKEAPSPLVLPNE